MPAKAVVLRGFGLRFYLESQAISGLWHEFIIGELLVGQQSGLLLTRQMIRVTKVRGHMGLCELLTRGLSTLRRLSWMAIRPGESNLVTENARLK